MLHTAAYGVLEHSMEYFEQSLMQESACTFTYVPQSVKELVELLTSNNINIDVDTLMEMGVRRYAFGTIVDKDLIGSVQTSPSQPPIPKETISNNYNDKETRMHTFLSLKVGGISCRVRSAVLRWQRNTRQP